MNTPVSRHLIRVPHDLGPFSVLVADDDAGCRESVAEALERAGHRVIPVSSGSDALAVVSRAFVHVTILDMNMPGMSGLDTFRMLRRMQRALPVLFMTADSEQNLVAKALDEGAFRLLAKPIDFEQLRSTVLQALVDHYMPSS